jgi:hypothetical protein
MERRNDIGPDVGLLANLALQSGRGGMSGGGSGSYSGTGGGAGAGGGAGGATGFGQAGGGYGYSPAGLAAVNAFKAGGGGGGLPYQGGPGTSMAGIAGVNAFSNMYKNTLAGIPAAQQMYGRAPGDTTAYNYGSGPQMNSGWKLVNGKYVQG